LASRVAPKVLLRLMKDQEVADISPHIVLWEYQYPYNVLFFFLQLYQLENIKYYINTEKICIDREPNSILAFLGPGVRIFWYN
jgi:hypothetical protein